MHVPEFILWNSYSKTMEAKNQSPESPEVRQNKLLHAATKLRQKFSNRQLLVIGGLLAVLIIGTSAALIANNKEAKSTGTNSNTQNCPTPTACGRGVDTSLLTQKYDPSHGTCKGTGPISFTHSPIPTDQIALVLPLGTMIGGHTTPIDHGYIFGTRVHDSVPNEYPVAAPADGYITEVSISARNSNENFVDHALTISYNCQIYTHYLNMDSFDESIRTVVGTLKDSEIKNVSIPVKAGQIIGHTGTHGIDLYVWNLSKKLTGFANPDQYDKVEAWKNYTVDPFEYFVPAVKQQLLAKNPRTAQPTGGKIDYDIVGRAIGNWYKVGTGGFGGNTAPGEGNNFWSGHLAIVPDALDPTGITISIGDWNGIASQFAVPRDSVNPKEVSVATGAVKYEVYDQDWIVTKTGISWDRTHMQGPVRYQPRGPVLGTVMLQMIDDGHLKLETFPGKSAANVNAFSETARTYER